MRLLRRSTVAWVLVLSAPGLALAQTAAPTDLVGTWVSTMMYKDKGVTTKYEEFLAFRADSTWSRTNKKDGVDVPNSQTGGHWYISSDSVWFGNPTATDTIFDPDFGGRIDFKERAAKAVLQGDKLYLPTYEEVSHREARAQQQGRTLTFKELTEAATEYHRVP